jgi:hypothetical protein
MFSAAVEAEDVRTVNLTIETADTPRLRLEQTSGMGKTPQIWDLSANETGFFIDDVTAATTPIVFPEGGIFKVDLVLNTFQISNTGNYQPIPFLKVGCLGTGVGGELMGRFQIADDPIGRLDILNRSGSSGVNIPQLRGTSAPQNAALVLEGLVGIDAGAAPVIAVNSAKNTGVLANRTLAVFRNGNSTKVTVGANGAISATSFGPPSSRAIKDKIVDLDSDQALAALKALTPVEFVYKDDPSEEPRLGFIAEDVPELVAAPDRQSVPIMDVFATVTSVARRQQRAISQQRQSITDQSREIDEQQKTFEHHQRAIDEQQKSIQAQNQAIAERQKLIRDLTRRLTELEVKEK